MEVKKTFVRAGIKYRPGMDAPDTDKAATDHYLRLGLIGPSETKPAAPTVTKSADGAEGKLSKLNKDALLELAAEQGLDIPGGATKADIIATIDAASKLENPE